MNVAGTVLEDQADGDIDLSIKQRLVLAGGSTLAGAGEEVGIEGVSETLEVAGMYRKINIYTGIQGYMLQYCRWNSEGPSRS